MTQSDRHHVTGRQAFVIGHPIAHSRSPLIHRHWLDRYGIEGDYQAIDVAPADLSNWLDALDPSDTPGGNVTVPHKERVHAHLGPDRLDEAARAIGAVNTLWFEDGQLRGGCTDGVGFGADLDARAPKGFAPSEAVVVGAGGAARAVVHALRGRGIAVTIANRTLSRAEGLAAEFGARAVALREASDAIGAADLVVNTASLGMSGTEETTDDDRPPHLDPRSFRAGSVAYDIVYTPLETPFLRAARAGGATGIDGLGMLLHQAVPGFRRWFGREPEVTPALRTTIEATL